MGVQMSKRVIASAVLLSFIAFNAFAENCKVSIDQLSNMNRRIQSSLNRMGSEDAGNMSLEFINNGDLADANNICSLENTGSYPLVEGQTTTQHQKPEGLREKLNSSLGEGLKISLGDGTSDEFFIVGATKEQHEIIKKETASGGRLSLLVTLNNIERVEKDGTFTTLINYRQVHVVNRTTGDVMPLSQVGTSLGRIGVAFSRLPM
jgi:hypothetical protein